MREPAVKLGYFGRGMLSEERQDMRFPLSESWLAQRVKIETDSVGRPVNWMYET